MLYLRHKIFLIALCITWIHVFWIFPLGAQSLAFYKTEKVILNQPWIKHIPSASKPQILQHPSIGVVEIEEVGEEYFLRYDNKGIAEYDTVVLQTENDIYAYVLKNKFVVAAEDYHIGSSGRSYEIDVLANDSSYSNLYLTDIAFSEGVDARIDSQKIRIGAVDPGLYYVYYTACDEGENCDEGKLTIFISDPSKDRDTIVLREVLDQRLILPLPDDSYQLDRSSVENITVREEEFEVLFSHRDFGENKIEFLSSSGERLIYKIDFVNKWEKNGLNTRDRIFLLPENKASLDLTRNDLWKNVHSINLDHPDLNINMAGEGMVEIEPVKGFTGKTSFSYVTCVHPRCDTAIVDVYVDHFEPAKDVFVIDVSVSDPSYIPYYTPVHDFDFSIIEQPKSGELTVHEDGRGLLYTPSDNFSGEEKAIIRYSHPLSKGNEYRSEFVLNLKAGQGSVSCMDCVWPGDTDQSGVVDLGDLENIGRFIGEKGSKRDAGDYWMGQDGETWMSFEDSSLHHFDADGDGIISDRDVLTVLKNYGKEHGLYTKPVVAENIPVEILTVGDEIVRGEEFVLEFLVGDEDHLLTDISGFSAELEVEGAIVGQEQVEVIKDRSTWLKSYQPTIALKAPSRDNQVAVGEFRVRSIGADGHGTTLKLRIIVEDEIEGFRTSRAVGGKAVRIILKNMTLHAGEDKVRLPDRVLVVPVKEKRASEAVSDQIRVYPVPAGDHVNVRWDSGMSVRSVAVYNTSGMLIREYDVTPGEDRMKIDTGGMSDGVYILQLEGKEKTVVRKMSVMK